MTDDKRIQQEREREEAEYDEPGHQLGKDTPGLDEVPARKVAGPDAPGEGDVQFDDTPSGEHLGGGVLGRGEDVITKEEWHVKAAEPGRPSR
jgi:hypothetical protein